MDSITAVQISSSTISKVKAREKAIWENIIEIGNKLIAVKNVLPHGQFESWVKLEFQWGNTTALKYMKITQELSKPHHGVVLQDSSIKALYQLASTLSSSDEETKQEILEQVETKTEEKGKALTEKEIKEITEKIKKEYEASIGNNCKFSKTV